MRLKLAILLVSSILFLFGYRSRLKNYSVVKDFFVWMFYSTISFTILELNGLELPEIISFDFFLVILLYAFSRLMGGFVAEIVIDRRNNS